MITILHLITGLETGGAQRMLFELVKHTTRGRFRSVVVSMTGAGNVGPLIEAEDVALRSLEMRRGLPDPRGLIRLVRLLHELQPSILQSWLYHADLLALIASQFAHSARLLWNIRCTEVAGSYGLVKLLATFSASPDAVVVNSHAGKCYHRSQGYHPRHWEVIPNGIDDHSFFPDPVARQRSRAELGIAQDAVAILLPARYHAMKDHANFLCAAGMLAETRPDVRFACAGAGVELENRKLTGAIAKSHLEGQVELLGHRPDLRALYPAFDIVTLSSAYGEGFPNVLGEAMASGVPCVATDVGDARPIIGDTGIIVPPRDPRALAAAWHRLADIGAEGRTALGERARTRIGELYGIHRMVARFEALYEQVACLGTPVQPQITREQM